MAQRDQEKKKAQEHRRQPETLKQQEEREQPQDPEAQEGPEQQGYPEHRIYPKQQGRQEGRTYWNQQVRGEEPESQERQEEQDSQEGRAYREEREAQKDRRPRERQEQREEQTQQERRGRRQAGWKERTPESEIIEVSESSDFDGSRHEVRNKSHGVQYAGNWREILATGGFFAVLFVVLMCYLGNFTAVDEEEMVNNSYNPRQEILLSRNYRGAIYDRNGEFLAVTLMDEEQNEIRVYPHGSLFAHIVGYSTKGRMGVEALANYYLINTHTSLKNKAANDEAGVKNPGDNVYTTLDTALQQVADTQLDIYRGAIVVTEVSTGKLLAMVSHPNFDPNEIDSVWDSVIEDEESSVLLNRAAQGLYPPGSTFKIITALEYIRQNPNTYQDYSFQCRGYFSSGKDRVSCYHGTSHGTVDLKRSFAISCNSSFANMGMSLDWGKYEETLKSLLFQEELPLTFNYAKSSVSVSEEMSAAEIMQTSFGQGRTLITPIHLNMITSAAANGGILMKPYVIDHVENDRGTVIKAFKPDSYGRLMSEKEAEILREYMTAVVESGNASNLSGYGYTVAGKTGSAEFNEEGDSHAWFTGFAPAENPEICVTIVVEGAGGGGDYAAPIARRIFDAYFKRQN